MANITDTTDAEIKATGTLKIKESILYRWFVSNRDAFITLIWGTRFTNAIPHNHASDGGVLLSRGLLQLSLGPHFREGTANSPVLGIPIAPPQAGVSMVTNPKLLASCGMLLPGGVKTLYGRVGVSLPGGGSRTVTLKVTLRVFYKAGYGPISGTGYQAQTVTITTSAAGNYFDAAVIFNSLDGLGAENIDRWVEVCLWQASNPPAATNYRALFVALWPGTESSQKPPPEKSVPLSHIEPTEFIAPSYLVEKWLRKGRYLLDGLAYGVLGQIPGKKFPFTDSPDEPDRTSPWFKLITGQHGHTGKSEGDGAVVRYPLSALSCCVDYGDDGSGEVTADSWRGQKIDPSAGGTGSFNTLTRFAQRVSIGKGCKGLDVCFALLPGHSSPEGRLFVYVQTKRIVNPDVIVDDIVTGLSSDGGTGVALAVRIAGFRGIEMKPINTIAYRLNNQRENNGYSGHWTAEAEKPNQPDGVLGTNLYRISQTLRIDIAPTTTDDYNVELRFALQNQAGSWVSAARLQWLAIAPTMGF